MREEAGTFSFAASSGAVTSMAQRLQGVFRGVYTSRRPHEPAPSPLSAWSYPVRPVPAAPRRAREFGPGDRGQAVEEGANSSASDVSLMSEPSFSSPPPRCWQPSSALRGVGRRAFHLGKDPLLKACRPQGLLNGSSSTGRHGDHRLPALVPLQHSEGDIVAKQTEGLGGSAPAGSCHEMEEGEMTGFPREGRLTRASL